MKIFLEKILARWWSRIIFFLLLWGILFLVEEKFFFRYSPALSLFAASIITESLRRNGAWFTIGLYPRKTVWREIFWGKIFALAGFGINFLALILLGAGCQISENILIQNLLLISFRIFIFAAAEEFFFRGIIFQSLAERFNPALVMIAGSVIFSFVHIFNPEITWIALANIFLANILMTAMYLATESLWPSIAFHFVWNWLQFAFTMPLSGQRFGWGIFYLETKFIPLNLRWLTGGLFGIEEGIITTIFLFCAIIFVPKVLKISAFVSAKKFRRKFAESALWMKHSA